MKKLLILMMLTFYFIGGVGSERGEGSGIGPEKPDGGEEGESDGPKASGMEGLVPTQVIQLLFVCFLNHMRKKLIFVTKKISSNIILDM